MNIVFLIGNGFDINLDLKTRYKDFYEYYISIPSASDVVQKLKKEIEKNIQNWSDLEVKFGKHTKHLNSTDEFFEVFEDIEDNLADYLGGVEGNFDFSHIDAKNLYKYLAFPENSLPLSDKNELVTYKNQWASHQWNIYVITFNYTETLEKILNYENKAIQINSQLSIKNPILIQRIEHIHGFIDERMVMGVNDISQVENKDFHNNQEVL